MSNIDSLIGSFDVQEMVILEELQSYHSVKHSIVVYLFRETSLSSLADSVDRSLGGGEQPVGKVRTECIASSN